jgi:hypothetical protein
VGQGVSLKCADAPDYRWYFNCGEGSNNKVELMGAWVTLTIVKRLEIQCLQVLGISK